MYLESASTNKTAVYNEYVADDVIEDRRRGPNGDVWTRPNVGSILSTVLVCDRLLRLPSPNPQKKKQQP